MADHAETNWSERQVLTIAEFCSRNRLSHYTYHKMKLQDRGPREIHIGRAIRISLEAEKDWHRAREMPDDAEARLLVREREARQKKARESAASPKHISKQRKAR